MGSHTLCQHWSVVALHVEVAVVCDGEDVRRHFSDLLVGVEADLVCRVDGQQLIRVHQPLR